MEITFERNRLGHWIVSIPDGWRLYHTTQGEVYDRVRDALTNNGITVQNPLRVATNGEGSMDLALSGNIPGDPNQLNAIFNTVIGELSTYNPN